MTLTASPETHLLAAILDEPERDDVRLALADWYEQEGECARSELIRVQIELANWPKDNRPECMYGINYVGPVHGHDAKLGHPCYECHPLSRPLVARERELLERHGWRWLPEVRDVCWDIEGVGKIKQGRIIGVKFSRGFPAAITCTMAQWLGERGLPQGTSRSSYVTKPIGPLVVSRCPVTEVVFSGVEPYQTGPSAAHFYWWHDDDAIGIVVGMRPETPATFIPRVLFELLDGYDPELIHDTGRGYATADLAQAALSRAAIKQARQQGKVS